MHWKHGYHVHSEKVGSKWLFLSIQGDTVDFTKIIK